MHASRNLLWSSGAVLTATAAALAAIALAALALAALAGAAIRTFTALAVTALAAAAWFLAATNLTQQHQALLRGAGERHRRTPRSPLRHPRELHPMAVHCGRLCTSDTPRRIRRPRNGH